MPVIVRKWSNEGEQHRNEAGDGWRREECAGLAFRVLKKKNRRARRRHLPYGDGR